MRFIIACFCEEGLKKMPAIRAIDIIASNANNWLKNKTNRTSICLPPIRLSNNNNHHVTRHAQSIWVWNWCMIRLTHPALENGSSSSDQFHMQHHTPSKNPKWIQYISRIRDTHVHVLKGIDEKVFRLF